MTALQDAEARRRILTELDRTFFVEAAAGTGKTAALVGRIIAVVRTGVTTLDRIVAVTFTEKAAGEMKLRVRTEIEKVRTEATDDERTRLDRALEELELARIGTIHAFCGDILHERPIEAGIDPLFQVAAEADADALADEAFETWFQRILLDPPEGVRRVLRRRSPWNPAREQLRRSMKDLREHRDYPDPWRRDPFEREREAVEVMDGLAAVTQLAAESSWSDDPLTKNLLEIGRFIAETARLEAVRGRDLDGLEAELKGLARSKSWNHKGGRRTTYGAFTREDVLARRDRAKAALDQYLAKADADLAPLLHEELKAPIAVYETLMTRAGRLDFLDLLIKVRDVIRGDDAIRAELQARFTHFFVDEFQDTDPLQAEILLLLAADNGAETDWRAVRPRIGKLFVVGDPKQSIYRFRRADVALYEDVKRRLLAAGAELLHLTTSFRAPPSIHGFINRAFAPSMVAAPDGSQAGYVPLSPVRPETVGRPTVIALPVPRPYQYDKVTKRQVEESFPDAVGAFIDWLVNQSGWTVEDNGNLVPIRPRHIAILLRRFRTYGSDITRSYVRALEVRRIPHVLVGGRSFHDREEVIALRNALTAIEWPDDELRVFATLRGPLFGFSDEALLAFRQVVVDGGKLRTRRLNPFHRFDGEVIPEVAAGILDALQLLRRLHVGRNHRPIAETTAMFLDAVRAHAGIALWPTGEQALGNCQRLIDMARRFERSASSFRGFVEKLDSDAETGEADEAPIVEEGTEGVRLMTVHKAKGLEFPVVILADPTCRAARDTPSRHVDPARRLWVEPVCGSAPLELIEAADEELRRDQAEAVRVAYVAATRARDLLVMPVCGDQALEGWLESLNPMLYPPDAARRHAEPVTGCPEFGEDSVVDRGPDGHAPPIGAVRPGLHRPQGDGPAVVWWDPNVLRLDLVEQTALRYRQILEADPDGVAAAAGEAAYDAWRSARATLLSDASRPSVNVSTVTALANGKTDEDAKITAREAGVLAPDVEVVRIKRSDQERTGGRRFGALVHGLLAAVDLGASVPAIEAVAALHGRTVGASEDEVKAAVAIIRDALASPLLRRAAGCVAAGTMRRETPVLMRRDDGMVVEGVVDLAFREEDQGIASWTVVDFKTDREFDAAAMRHVEQVRLYCEAVAAATREPTRGVLLVL